MTSQQKVPDYWPKGVPIPDRNWAAYNAHAVNSIKKCARLWWGAPSPMITRLLPGAYWIGGCGLIINSELYGLHPAVKTHLPIDGFERESTIEHEPVVFYGFDHQTAWAIVALTHADIAQAILDKGVREYRTLEDQQVAALFSVQAHFPEILADWLAMEGANRGI